MKLKELKLNNFVNRNLNNRQMNSLRGGGVCGCGCNYAGQPGGSSSSSNSSANSSSGYYSPGGNNEWVISP
jgi:natural product precursor